MASELIDIPSLKISSRLKPKHSPSFNSQKRYSFRYDSRDHHGLPHVVKFSGGRSSGMMLFTLLHNGILKPDRGDVIVFNNTSAEHPATYEYISRCQKLAEEKYGIPFFWTEFQTYEDVTGGEWVRLPSYRLVLPSEFSEQNPNGYHCRGEVFEELLSWKRFLPSQFKRICTEQMKIIVTREFLADWFAVKEGIDRQGHYYEHSMMNDDSILRMHRRNGGKTPDEILLAKTSFVRSRPWFRPEQRYIDYSKAVGAIKNETLEDKRIGDRVALSGDDYVDYVAFIGFRGDEPVRVARMKARNYSAPECQASVDPHIMLPEGEYVYAPLAEIGVTKEDVFTFWKKQKWDLRLPHNVNMSNCVYCFLKGSQILARIATAKKEAEKKLPKKLRAQPNTPADVNWWAEIERKYGRDLEQEGRKILNNDTAGEKPFIGFWGINGRMSFRRLAEAQNIPADLSQIYTENSVLPCDCTD